tara:strand:- start:246 stop:437 length:192 start_codon:yes stop_codon:yes gene_type:complete
MIKSNFKDSVIRRRDHKIESLRNHIKLESDFCIELLSALKTADPENFADTVNTIKDNLKPREY